MSDKNAQYQKIASAIYLITSFFGEQEPLKWRLRSLSADLAGESVKDKHAVTLEMRTLFGLARSAQLVSDTNYEILNKELVKIGEETASPVAALLKSEAVIAAPVRESEKDTSPALPHREAVTREEKIAPEAVTDMLPSTREIEERASATKTPSLKEYGAVSVKKNSRQSTIIGLLKRKKEIMIKDVSPLISGCSEKTIQRELSDMVAAGVLKRIGEKRWTRYTLAQPE